MHISSHNRFGAQIRDGFLGIDEAKINAVRE
jgi:hypothetical protein